MPGSVTISHLSEAPATIEHTDAQRLAVLLDEMGHMLAMEGPNRLSDSQVSVLCEGKVHHREELSRWCRSLAAQLHDRL